jgi:hypothetical protein
MFAVHRQCRWQAAGQPVRAIPPMQPPSMLGVYPQYLGSFARLLRSGPLLVADPSPATPRIAGRNRFVLRQISAVASPRQSGRTYRLRRTSAQIRVPGYSAGNIRFPKSALSGNEHESIDDQSFPMSNSSVQPGSLVLDLAAWSGCEFNTLGSQEGWNQAGL